MESLCFNCMKDTNNAKICPHCGYDMDNAEQNAPYLPLGVVLQERYIVGKNLYSNRESATYMCYDKFNKSPVILKEFMPASIGGRAVGKVPLIIKKDYENVAKTLENEFLEYYRGIARCRDLSAVIPIYDIFLENNTSYIVEEKIDSIPFEEYIQRSGGKIDWNTARPLFMPLLSSLATLSEAGIYHLGVSPQNLVVTTDGKLKLINFAINQLRVNGSILGTEYFEGSTAPEQYKPNSIVNQKADIYGFTATLYYALTGSLPKSADKTDGKIMISNSVLRKLPSHVVNAIANGLQLSVVKRTADFETLRMELGSAPSVQAMQKESVNPTPSQPRQKKLRSSSQAKQVLPGFVWVLISCAVSMFLFVMVGMTVVDHIDISKWFKTTNNVIDNNTTNNGMTSTPDSTNLGEDEFLVPDLSKMTYESAINLASAVGKYNIILSNTEEFSSIIKEGCVISQSPAANTVAKEGVTICVVLSKGAEKRNLPSISGKTIESAVGSLNQLGFITCVSEEYSDMVLEGKVIRYKEYSAGDSVTYGSKVEVVVSKGVEPDIQGGDYVTLPDIEDESFTDAQKKLTDKGLFISAIKQYSNKIDSGKCIGYDENKAGDKVEEGSTVVVIVSRGALP